MIAFTYCYDGLEQHGGYGIAGGISELHNNICSFWCKGRQKDFYKKTGQPDPNLKTSLHNWQNNLRNYASVTQNL